jgi:hypothetical protein
VVAVLILEAQQHVAPTTTPYVNMTTGLKLGGTYGSPGSVPISTGSGTSWGTVSPGTAIPGLTSDGLTPGGIIVAGNVAATSLAGPLTGHASLDLPLTGGTLSGALAIESSISLADGSVPANAAAAGVVCDNATDTTTTLQAAVNAEASRNGTLLLPTGTCVISSSITIPFTQQLRIAGQGKLSTIIKMTANNTPIFVANQPNTHSIEIDHLQLQYSSHQSTSNTQSYGIQWTSAASDPQGFYRWNVHDTQIDGAYICMGIYTTAGNTETVWGSLFLNNTFTNVSQSAISLVPTVPIGMPTNLFINQSVFDTGGGAPVPAGPAIILSAVEATFIGLDVEGWKNEAIWSTGGGFVHVIGAHVEHETLTTSGRFFFIANAPFMLESANLSMDGSPALTGAQVVGEGSGATVTLKNVTMFVAPAGGSTFYWTTGNVANSLNFSNLNDALSGMTSTAGVVPLSAIASWPDVYPLLRQNQSSPQLILASNSGAGTAGYTLELGPDAATPGKIFYRWTGSGNNWHVNWLYVDGSQVWHIQKCSDVAGTTAGPPTTAPSGCADEFTVDGSANATAQGAYKNSNGTVIPSAATGFTGTANVVLSQSPTINNPTMTTPTLGAAAATSLAIGGGANNVYRCATAGTLPAGALTTNAANCGTTATTSLTVN